MQEEDKPWKLSPIHAPIHQRLDSGILTAMDCRTDSRLGLGDASASRVYWMPTHP